MIQMLIDDDVRSEYDGSGLFAMMLADGFKGYNNFTDQELVDEMSERELWNEWFKETT
jgi:hypothetical protein